MQKNDQRFSKLQDETDRLKKGMNIASEAGSCQVWDDDCVVDLIEEAVSNYYF